MSTTFKRNPSNNALINIDNSALADRKEKKIIMSEINYLKLKLEKIENFLKTKGFTLDE